MSVSAGLISLDWGTTTLRAYLVASDGRILERRESPDGILSFAGRDFEGVVRQAAGAWLKAHPRLPILMSGMIGSRQGWVETPYLACPASAHVLAAHLHRVDVTGCERAAIVPGLTTRDGDEVPDVMRGEETQVLGAMVLGGLDDGALVLPGTHSKWVTVDAGQIAKFATYMTGEVFAALKGHTILGRLMAGEAIDASGFALGVKAGHGASGPPGGLLHTIFSARTLALNGELAPDATAGYLSGLLVGAEFAAAAPVGAKITIVGSAGLAGLYADAARLLGHEVRLAPPDCVVAGHVSLARAAGWMEKVGHA
jgi:2-dehydro-3-deoxygalactonokinase